MATNHLSSSERWWELEKQGQEGGSLQDKAERSGTACLEGAGEAGRGWKLEPHVKAGRRNPRSAPVRGEGNLISPEGKAEMWGPVGGDGDFWRT